MTIAFVDSLASSSLGASGGTTAPFDSSGVKLLVVAISRFQTGTFSDSEANAYTLLHTTTESSITLEWYYAINPSTSAAHTFTFTGTNSFPSVLVSAYSGLDITFDQKSVGQATATSVAPGSLTPANANSLVVSTIAHEIGETQAVDGSFTIRANNVRIAGVQDGCAIGDLIQTTAAASNPAWSSASSTPRVAGQAVFYQAESNRRLPIVFNQGYEQLQPGDVLEDVVYSDAEFGTDNVMLRSDGTIRGSQRSGIIVSDDNFIGINTSSPVSVIDVIGTSSPESSFTVTRTVDNSNPPRISFKKTRGIIGGPTNIQADDSVGEFTFEAFVNGSLSTDFMGRMICRAYGTNTGGMMPTGFELFTTDQGASAPHRSFIVDGAGNGGLFLTQSPTVTTAFPTGGGTPVFILDQATSAPTGVRSDTAGIFSLDVDGTAHLFAVNDADEAVQLTGLRVLQVSSTPITLTTETVVLVDASSAAVVINLPAASAFVNQLVHVKKTDSSANSVTIEANGSETIDGQLNVVTAVQFTTTTVVSDGTEWHII